MKRLRRALRLLVLTLGTASLCAGPGAGQRHTTAVSPTRAMDTYLRRMTANGEFNGAVVVARAGRILFARGYGFADRAAGRRNSARTRFRVPGMVVFNEVAAYQLRDRGRLDLDTSVCRYVPRCPVRWEPITPSALLAGKSGLPTVWQLGDRATPPTLPAAVEWLKHRPLRFPPARPSRHFDGSPAPQLLLSYVIGRVSGVGWLTYLKRSIFARAGMRETGVRPSPQRRAVGYLLPSFRRGRDVEFSRPDPAHGLWTTVGDLARFDAALYRGSLLAPSTREELYPSGAHTVQGLHGFDRVQGVVRDGWYSMLGHHAPDRIFVGLLMNARKADYRFYDIELRLAGLAARGGEPRRPVVLPREPVIAFSGELGAITASSADGSGRVALTRPYAGRGFPVAWSSDGRHLLFNRFQPNGAFVIDADGRHERRVARGTALAWTREGGIAVAGGDSVWIVSANGSSRRRATAPGLRDPPMALAFSPDGRRLVFTRPVGELGPNLRSRILLTDLETGATRPLRSEPGFYLISADAWSPDGAAIAFTRRARVGSFDGGLYVTDAEGRTLRRLVRDAGNAPSWSRDGRRLAYNVGISCQLRILTLDSGTSELLPFEGCRPVWRP